MTCFCTRELETDFISWTPKSVNYASLVMDKEDKSAEGKMSTLSQLPTYLFVIIFISAPTKSPQIQGAFGIDASTIQFNLIPPRPYYAAYEITGYSIRYWKSEKNSSSQIKTFHAETVTVNLTGLEAYTEYCLSAAAVSSYGTGYYGSCTTAMTNESGNSMKDTFDDVHAIIKELSV